SILFFPPPPVNGATALGAFSLAVGTGTLAIGDQAMGGTITYDVAGGFITTAIANGTAIGSHAVASADNGTAVGMSAQATAQSSTALGQNARASGSGSIAIGANSVADQANTVSVGSAGAERRIVNVAAGTAPTDAVNVSQLIGVTTNVTALQTGLAATNLAVA